MPTGISLLHRPDKLLQPHQALQINDCYFSVRLHSIQAHFNVEWLVRPGYLFLCSIVESSFRPEERIQSLHLSSVLYKGSPCKVTLQSNLTDWLPFQATESLGIVLSFHILQACRLRELVNQLEQLPLQAQVSMGRTGWAAALQVSKVVDGLLRISMQNIQEFDLFNLSIDLNVPQLQAGYYVVWNAPNHENWSNNLRINEEGQICCESHIIDRLSYAVLEVLSLPRRGEESAIGEPWWELLQVSKEQALRSLSVDCEEQHVLDNWYRNLFQVRELARQENGYLTAEIHEILRRVHMEIEDSLSSQSIGFDKELQPELQSLLGVRTERDLQDSVRDYEDALEVSRQLVRSYENVHL